MQDAGWGSKSCRWAHRLGWHDYGGGSRSWGPVLVAGLVPSRHASAGHEGRLCLSVSCLSAHRRHFPASRMRNEETQDSKEEAGKLAFVYQLVIYTHVRSRSRKNE